jgi:serine/threonine protein kinase
VSVIFVSTQIGRLPNPGSTYYNQRHNLAELMALSAGARLDPYEIVGLIGAGGTGEVYRARDPRLGREVAVKVLPAAFNLDHERERRFEREARAAALNHPNILAVYDIGTDGVWALAGVVRGEPSRDIRRQARIVTGRIDLTLQDAHGSLRARVGGRCKAAACGFCSISRMTQQG